MKMIIGGEREETISSCKALFHRGNFNALNIRTIEIYLARLS